MDKDLPYWLALNEFPRFGPISFTRLYSHFGSMEQAFKGSLSELIAAGISKKDAENFIHVRDEINPDFLIDLIKKQGFSVIRRIDPEYPELLKNIYDPPALLYVYGKLPTSDIAHLAVVGSRKASTYGLIASEMLSHDIAAAGVVIVSGLAYGIDESAHKAALNAKGTTIAVLASGLLKLTARQRYLADMIVKSGGAIISEFPPTRPALKHYFPIRNRIVSGLSHGTLIIEAAEKSGSLITANSALDQNREVFAVPGPINSKLSAGTNNLIKMGAYPATTASDILDILNVNQAPVQIKASNSNTKEETAILSCLSKAPIHIDEITRITQLESKVIAGALALMEMRGHVRQIGGMYYILV